MEQVNKSSFMELEDWSVVYEQPPKFSPFWFEKADIKWWKEFMLDNPNIPWYACAVYLTTIFGLQAYMKNKTRIRAQRALILWNMNLAMFSAIGFYRVGQQLMHNFNKPTGYYGTVCLREGRNFPTEYWLLLFTLSKFIELGDTFFIVLRKQPLHALQWYHHGIVTVVAWKLFPWSEPVVLYYATINFGIHAFMYSYFAAKALGYRVPESLAMTLTTLQILQMVVNTGNDLYTVVIAQFGYDCKRHPISIMWSFIIYVTLWAMFVNFFRQRYASKPTKKVE